MNVFIEDLFSNQHAEDFKERAHDYDESASSRICKLSVKDACTPGGERQDGAQGIHVIDVDEECGIDTVGWYVLRTPKAFDGPLSKSLATCWRRLGGFCAKRGLKAGTRQPTTARHAFLPPSIGSPDALIPGSRPRGVCLMSVVSFSETDGGPECRASSIAGVTSDVDVR